MGLLHESQCPKSTLCTRSRQHKLQQVSIFSAGYEPFRTSFCLRNRPVQNTYHAARGMILNKNLLGDFKDCDKTEVINSEGRKLWERLKSCELFDPSLISSFFILSFAVSIRQIQITWRLWVMQKTFQDLKKYHYYYWFCFPAFSKIPTYLIAAKPISTLLNESMVGSSLVVKIMFLRAFV